MRALRQEFTQFAAFAQGASHDEQVSSCTAISVSPFIALRDGALAIATSGSAHIGYLMAQGERFLARVLPASDTAPTGALAMVVPLAPYVEQLKAKLVKQNAKSARAKL